jgi:hypothetical protein
VRNARLVIATGFVETPEPLEILTKGQWIQNRRILPKEVPWTRLREYLTGKIAAGEVSVSGDLDRFQPPFLAGVEIVHRDSESGLYNPAVEEK